MKINKLNIQLQVVMYNLKKKKIKLHLSIPHWSITTKKKSIHETRWALPFSLLRERERERDYHTNQERT